MEERSITIADGIRFGIGLWLSGLFIFLTIVLGFRIYIKLTHGDNYNKPSIYDNFYKNY